MTKKQHKTNHKTKKKQKYIGGFYDIDGNFIGYDKCRKPISYPITINSLNTILKSNADNLQHKKGINSIIPLFELNLYLKNCGILKYALHDMNDNNIYVEPQLIADTDEIYVFKIMSDMKIKLIIPSITYSEYKTRYPSYNYTQFTNEIYKFYNENNIYPSFIDYLFYNEINIITKLYNNTNLTYYVDDDVDDDDVKIAHHMKLESLKTFILDIIRKLEDENNKLKTIEYHNNFNIIRLFAFMNDIDILFKIIDIDYDNINKILQIPNTKDKESLRKKFNLKLKHTDNYYKIIDEKLQKITLIANDYTDILNLDLLIDELEYDAIYNTENYDIKQNNKLFYKAIKLVRSIYITPELLDKIINIMNYYEIGEQYRKYDSLKNNSQKTTATKKIPTKINYSKHMVLFKFIVLITEFLIKINNIKHEFIKYKIYFYKEFIKIIIGQCYFSILNELQSDNKLPISLVSHLNKYKLLNTEVNPNINLFIESEKTMLYLIKDKKIQITLLSGTYSFVSCGESTLLNLIKYLLFDITDNSKITQKYIDILNTQYPKNILTDIFNVSLVVLPDENTQTLYLEDNLDKFVTLVASHNNIYDKILYNNGYAELNPTFINSIKILCKLLGIEQIKNLEEAKTILNEISIIFHKKILEITDIMVSFNGIFFIFEYSHSITKLKSGKSSDSEISSLPIKINNFIITDDYSNFFIIGDRYYENIIYKIFMYNFEPSVDLKTIKMYPMSDDINDYKEFTEYYRFLKEKDIPIIIIDTEKILLELPSIYRKIYLDSSSLLLQEIPKNIYYLVLPSDYENSYFNDIPDNITHLELQDNLLLSDIGEKVYYLVLPNNFKLSYLTDISPHITHLEIKFNIKLYYIPPNITHIIVNKKYPYTKNLLRLNPNLNITIK